MSKIDLILVPQGAEYQAVVRGLKSSNQILAIPIGSPSFAKYLETATDWRKFSNVLVMGLGGSLTADHDVGDVVVYQDCMHGSDQNSLICDPNLTAIAQRKLPNATLVNSLTSDRLIHLAQAKRDLQQVTKAAVVDMEGYKILEVLTKYDIAVAMVRVISDDANHDLPDLSTAIAADGNLQTLPLAIALIRQPFAARRLITGSLKALKILEQTARTIMA